MFKNFFAKQAAFEVIGGQNRLKKSSSNIYRMISRKNTHEEGIVEIKGELYYFLGVHKDEKHSRSAGKAAAGAIVGTVLTGGIGAIALAGAAIGGRKRDKSTFFIDFANYETKEEFTVQAKQLKGTTSISDFRVANINL